MAKTYLATQTQVQTVSDSVTTVNTQINAPSTGIEPRLATVESNQAQVTTNKNDIATIRGELDNPTTGVYKQLTDIDTEINEAGTGIKARLDDLEQGGTSTMKFRLHTQNGKYEDGEVAQRDGSLWKANSAIDGTTTAVPFVVGTSGQTWSAVSKHNYSEKIDVVASDGTKASVNASGGLAHLTVNQGGALVSVVVDTSRNRAGILRSSAPAALKPDDFLLAGDIIGSASTVYKDNITASRAVVTDSANKIAASSVTSTELGKLSGTTTDSGATIADTDRFVHNDSGVMTQTSFTKVWDWIVTKASGAVSTVLTSTLDVNKVVISNGTGRLAASSVTASALGALDGLDTSKTLDYQMKEKSHRLRTFSDNALAPHEIITDITFITTSETVLPAHIPFYCTSEAEARQNLPYFINKLLQCIGGLDNDRAYDYAGTLYSSLLSNGNFVTTTRTVEDTDADPGKGYYSVFKLILGANSSKIWWAPVSPWNGETASYYGCEGLAVINAAGTTWISLNGDINNIKIYSTSNLTKAASGVSNSNTYINKDICAAYFMPISLRLKV